MFTPLTPDSVGYATAADWPTYTGETAPVDSERLLRRAERDIDLLFPGGLLPRTEPHQLDTTSWSQWERDTLAEATVLQAEWIAARPRPGATPAPQVKSEEGPDFKRTFDTAGASPASAGGGYNPELAHVLGRIAHRRQHTPVRARP